MRNSNKPCMVSDKLKPWWVPGVLDDDIDQDLTRTVSLQI